MPFSDLVVLYPYVCHKSCCSFFPLLFFSLFVFAVVSFLIKLSAVVNWADLIMFCTFVLVSWLMRFRLLL